MLLHRLFTVHDLRAVRLTAITVIVACGGGGGAAAGPSSAEPVATATIMGADTVLTDDKLNLSVELRGAAGTVLTGRAVTWASGADSIATVTSDGVVTPVRPGNATITATSEGKSATALVPVRIRFAEIAAGRAHACALTLKGAAWCWGNNFQGQGGFEARYSSRPTPVSTTLRFRVISAGTGDHTCAIAVDGSSWCWGHNANGQLGDNTLFDRSRSPAPVAGDFQFSTIVAGDFHTCGLVRSGTAYCWGSNWDGQVNGRGADSAAQIRAPQQVSPHFSVAPHLTFSLISAGAVQTCATARDEDGAGFWCWGRNTEGALGDVPSAKIGFVSVAGFVRGLQLASGPRHTCASGYRPTGGILTPGGLCWGSNSSGQLGITLPTAYRWGPELNGALAITSGSNFGCALFTAGALRCWGGNERGQLGIGNVTPQGTMVELLGTFTKVEAGSSFTLALSTSGILYSWGANEDGQLGVGDAVLRTIGVPVAGQL